MISYKGYYIKSHGVIPGNFVIVTEGQGGRIPNKFKGMFTSTGVAKGLIDRYLETRATTKEKTNASETRTKSGD